MSFQGPAAPARELPIDPSTKLFRVPWLTWFRDLRQSVDSTPSQVTGGKVQLAAQAASIPTTPIPTDALAPGLYRVSYVASVTTPAGVTSDFTVTITWTTGGVTKIWTGALKNGNTTATYEASGPPLIHVDSSTPVSYAVAYNSNPAAAMAYEFNLVLEEVALD